ncbi:MAG: outer membrane protein transport protein, partial [Bacteroidia bacterium]|nr:outer membrane protein transport protein [Bacteroidia bacterium]
MKTTFLKVFALLFSTIIYAQAGHIMQGVGAVNMSMGGAATGQPLDISGAMQWNPAAISTFDDKIIKFDLGLFFSSPELYSTVPEFDSMGQPTGNFFSGNTEDDRGVSPMPALAMVWGKEDSKHTFGASAFGISGFGVTFPESMTNPINMPQSMGGFGHIESDYILLQIGGTWAYELSDKFSIGVEPTFNYATLELAPNPTANPTA